MKGVIRGSGDKTTYLIDGREVTKAQFDEAFPDQAIGTGEGLTSWHRPVVSDALAVHPRQVEEARELAKRKGVPVEFQPDGRPVFTSSRQFRDYARKHGFVHKGY